MRGTASCDLRLNSGQWTVSANSGPKGPVSRHRGSRHNSRAGHPGSLRCSSLRYSRYPRSSRLAIRAPRSGTYATIHGDGTLARRRFLPGVRAAGHILFEPLEIRVPLEEQMTRLGPLMRLARADVEVRRHIMTLPR